MPELRLENLCKNYGKVSAVQNLNLTITSGEFLVLVGPSGCGKTTTLRMIAGLEEITGGEIYLDDQRLADIPPKNRDMAMVFQDYALYPHMTVFNNIAFGLKMRHMKKEEIRSRVESTAELLGINDLLKRKPHALSGGERQRVALGRAIVRQPKVFLFDEPLSNLDAALRVQMREELMQLHAQLQTTFIYVTHDQIEAMTMASRIVVMDHGVVQQCDTPDRVYHHPANCFTAQFIGNPQINLIDALVVLEEGILYCVIGENKLPIPEETGKELLKKRVLNTELRMGIRPEHLSIAADASDAAMPAVIQHLENTGSDTYCYLSAPFSSQPLIARAPSAFSMSTSSRVFLSPQWEQVKFFDGNTGKTI